MSNKLLRTVEVNVRVRCVLWNQCSWEGKRKVKRMKHAMKQGCPKCGSPVEFISAVAVENGGSGIRDQGSGGR